MKVQCRKKVILFVISIIFIFGIFICQKINLNKSKVYEIETFTKKFESTDKIDIAIFGDSISTYKGMINGVNGVTEWSNGTSMALYGGSTSNAYYMPVDEMWWKRVANEFGWNVLNVEAIRKTRVTWDKTVDDEDDKNELGLGPSYYMAGNSRINNIGLKGVPDKIFIFAGINDIRKDKDTVFMGYPLGHDNYEDAGVSVFTNAYEKMIEKITTKYTNSEIILIIPFYFNTEKNDRSDRAAEIIIALAKHYNLKYVDLRSLKDSNGTIPTSYLIEKSDGSIDSLHPNSTGMKKIANKVIEVMNDTTTDKNEPNWSVSTTMSSTNNLKVVNVGDQIKVKTIFTNNPVNGTCGISENSKIVLNLGSYLIPDINNISVTQNGLKVGTTNYNSSNGTITINGLGNLSCNNSIEVVYNASINKNILNLSTNNISVVGNATIYSNEVAKKSVSDNISIILPNWTTTTSVNHNNNPVTVGDEVTYNTIFQNNNVNGTCGISLNNKVVINLSKYLTITDINNNVNVTQNGRNIGLKTYDVKTNTITISGLDELDCSNSLNITYKAHLNSNIITSNSNNIALSNSASMYVEEILKSTKSENINLSIKSPNISMTSTIESENPIKIGDKVKIINTISNIGNYNSFKNVITINNSNINITDEDVKNLKVYIDDIENNSIIVNSYDSSKIILSEITSINANSKIRIEYTANIDKNIVNNMTTDFIGKVASNAKIEYYKFNYDNVNSLLKTTSITKSNNLQTIEKNVNLITGNLNVYYQDEQGKIISETKVTSAPINSNYETIAKDIEYYSLILSPANKTGTIEENTNVVYIYRLNTGEKVIQKYINENGDIIQPAKDLCVGSGVTSICEITCPEIDMYNLKTNEPIKKTISYEVQTSECKYVKKAKVNVIYKDEDDNVIKTDILDGEVGQTYKVNPINIEKYSVLNTPNNLEGIYTKEDIDVIYRLKRIETDIIIKYVDENGNEITTLDVQRYPVGSEQLISAKEINGYQLNDGIDNVKLITPNKDYEYVFVYKKVNDFNNPQTGKFIPLTVLISLLSIVGIVIFKKKELFYKV